MRTAIEFPESLYRQGEQIARLQGVTIEEFVIRAVERELSAAPGSRTGQTPAADSWPHFPVPCSLLPASL